MCFIHPQSKRILLTMTGIFNNKVIDFTELAFHEMERSFNYGDGLFETIIVESGRIKFLNYHFERLQEGMKVLSLVGDEISYETLQRNIYNLMDRSGHKENARVKLQVWRQTGGFYIPQTNKANFLLSAKENVEKPKIIITSDIATSIHLNYSSLSGIKTGNALPYVLAGIEMKARNLDEIIILDNNGYLSECSSSNLFWLKNGEIFTPALSSGCIAGVMRRNILTQAKTAKRMCHEVLEKPAVLLQANQVFCCNVTGIKIFAKIGRQQFDKQLDTEISTWIK